MSDITAADTEHRFYSFMSVLTLVIVVIGFGHVYAPKLLSNTNVPLVIHVHAALFTSWLFVFVLQCFFILKKKINWHIRLGKIGVILAWIMLVSGIVTATDAAKSGHIGIPGVEFKSVEGFLLLNFSSAIIFTILVTAGIIFRKQPDYHKRFMLMASVAGLAPPGISRLPLISGHTPAIAGLIMIFILMAPLYDWRKQKQVHKAYLFSFPLIIFILPPVISALASTELWITFAQWLIQLN